MLPVGGRGVLNSSGNVNLPSSHPGDGGFEGNKGIIDTQTFLSVIFCFFLFEELCLLPECMFVQHMCPQRAERVLEPLKLELQTIVSFCVCWE